MTDKIEYDESPESKESIIDTLMKSGKKKGNLTYDEIIDALDEVQMDSDEIDNIYKNFEESGIELLDDDKLEVEDDKKR